MRRLVKRSPPLSGKKAAKSGARSNENPNVIPQEKLQELAPLYEEYMYSPNPVVPSVRQAKLIFDSECRKLYQNEPIEFRKQMTFEAYVAHVVVVQILDYFRPKQRFPSV